MICDGAYGTLLAPYVGSGETVDDLCRTDPNKVIAAHQKYIEAGAQCIQTNSFLAWQLSFPRRRNAYRSALECSQEAQNATTTQVLIHATIGPAGDEPSVYYRDIEFLLDNSVDGIRCETVTSLAEANAFARAWEEVAVGVASKAVVTMSISPSHGLDSWRWITAVKEAPNLTLGLNCCEGPAGLHETLHLLAEREPNPWFLPSAGLPSVTMDAAPWAEAVLADLEGISPGGIGGCCGTSPDHIAALAASFE